MAITTRCPACGSKFTDEGIAAELIMSAGKAKCGHCGFEGGISNGF